MLWYPRTSRVWTLRSRIGLDGSGLILSWRRYALESESVEAEQSHWALSVQLDPVLKGFLADITKISLGNLRLRCQTLLLVLALWKDSSS